MAGAMLVLLLRTVGRSREAWEGIRMICSGMCGVRWMCGMVRNCPISEISWIMKMH